MERKSFKDGFLSDLKTRVDFVGIVGKYTELTKKGGRYWVRCPFHFEKTPSFCIYPNEGFYKCYGCGESGDVISFVQKMENMDFMNAVEFLANSVNMEIMYADNKQGVDFSKQLKEKKEILSILFDACEYYKTMLYSTSSITPQNYIKKRKLTKNSLETFNIGYSKDYSGLIKELSSRYPKELLIDSGLANESNGKIYDVQAERLVFPLYNQMGQVVGFSGRILNENKELAKYKNTRSTMVFDKSKTIFGLYQALKSKAIDKYNYSLLVEGQIDVIMLHQNGFQNAVATLGTAFTEGHATQLKRVNNNVVICYDGDSAGQKATMKAADILTNAGLKVKIAQLPLGVDPDEYLRQFGVEQFTTLLDKSEEIYDYKLRKWAEEMNTSSNFDKTEYITKSIKLLAGLNSSAEGELYLPLIKKYTNVPIDALRESLLMQRNLFQVDKNRVNNTSNQNVSENLFLDAYEKADKFILASIIYKKDYIKNIDFSQLDFTNPDYNKIYSNIMHANESDNYYQISNLYDEFEVENNMKVKEIIDFNFSENDEINKKYFKECIIQNEILKLKKISEQLEKDYNNSKDLTERSKLAKELMSTKLKLKEKEKNLII